MALSWKPFCGESISVDNVVGLDISGWPGTLRNSLQTFTRILRPSRDIPPDTVDAGRDFLNNDQEGAGLLAALDPSKDANWFSNCVSRMEDFVSMTDLYEEVHQFDELSTLKTPRDDGGKSEIS
jgi:hypothetical protein